MSVVACLDLDRTVIYSARSLDLRMPDHEAPRLLCVEVYRSVPLSFMTEDAVAAFRALREVAEIVPTTTRTPEQLARVHLPGPPPRYAIAANGGHLLVDGTPDPDWAAVVRERLTGCAPLARVQEHLDAVSGDFVLNRRTASDLFCYAVVERAEVPDGWVRDLTGWCAELGWTVSLQGRKVYAVPRGLTKSAAAREVAARLGAHTLLAAGDSLLDADLLDAADRAVRPAHGELHDTGWTRHGLVVTSATGGAAGAELLGVLRELAVQGRSPARGRV